MIYTNAIVLSILGLTASARKLSAAEQGKMNDYLGLLGQFGKNYNDTDEFNNRLGSYMDNDDKIQECNYRAEHTDEVDPVVCGHNQFSDWTDEEYEAMLGFNGKDYEEGIIDDEERSDNEGEGEG